MKTLLRVLLAACVCAVMVGCTSLTGAPVAEGSDEDLRLTVIERLERDPVTAKLNIGVSVEGGVVTLSGRALNPVQRAQAEAIAQNAPGVKGVVDNFFAR